MRWEKNAEVEMRMYTDNVLSLKARGKYWIKDCMTRSWDQNVSVLWVRVRLSREGELTARPKARTQICLILKSQSLIFLLYTQTPAGQIEKYLQFRLPKVYLHPTQNFQPAYRKPGLTALLAGVTPSHNERSHGLTRFEEPAGARLAFKIPHDTLRIWRSSECP